MHIRHLRYNHRNTAFEAVVDVTDGGAKFRFPCRVHGQASLDPAILRDHMLRQASRQALAY